MKILITLIVILLMTIPASAAYSITTNKTHYGAGDENIYINFTGVTEYNEGHYATHNYMVYVYCASCPLRSDDLYPHWTYPEGITGTLDFWSILNQLVHLTFISVYNVGYENDTQINPYRYPFAGTYEAHLVDRALSGLPSVANTTFYVTEAGDPNLGGFLPGGVMERKYNELVNQTLPIDLDSTGEPGARINYILNSSWFWGGVIVLFLAGLGMEEGGLAGGAVGGLIGIVLVVVYDLMPLYAVFLLVIGLIAILVSYTSKGRES